MILEETIKIFIVHWISNQIKWKQTFVIYFNCIRYLLNKSALVLFEWKLPYVIKLQYML